uniref:2-hydroxyisoflavanone dehydratase-like n=1 Tax=Erigeron canadensis TaxID=72917 RepID=UPI001CB92BA0|nr:2-hydroxyisoflavanone dehydratase-like [Erigeron canadensis]
MAPTKKLIYEIPLVIRVYDDGSVERLAVSPFAPPCLDDPVTGISSKDLVISPNVSARLYLPKLPHVGLNKLPILVYYHGGGFIIGSAFDTWEHNYISTMVSYIKAVVVSVEYRLAPEHIIPAAYEDSWAALQWVASHSTSDQGEDKEPWLVKYGDFNRVYLGGDSAGANIVHHMALKTGKEKLPNDVKILGGFFGCPYFWGSKSTPDESLAYKCWMLASPNAEGGIDSPLINPFVSGKFDTGFGYKRLLVVVAEKDELRDYGLKYFDAVKESEWDGKVEFLQLDGGHCFYLLDSTCEKAKVYMNRLASFIV